MPGHKGAPQVVTCLIYQVLELQLALLAQSVLHLRRAAGVSLWTDAQVLAWKTPQATLMASGERIRVPATNKVTVGQSVRAFSGCCRLQSAGVRCSGTP